MSGPGPDPGAYTKVASVVVVDKVDKDVSFVAFDVFALTKSDPANAPGLHSSTCMPTRFVFSNAIPVSRKEHGKPIWQKIVPFKGRGPASEKLPKLIQSESELRTAVGVERTVPSPVAAVAMVEVSNCCDWGWD